MKISVNLKLQGVLMKILGIDTTRKSAKIFIVDSANKEDLYFLELNGDIKHSEGFFLYLEKALLEKSMAIDDFDCFACIVGPGSFTGIRVGMSIIKGFNKALNKSIISINTFDVLSQCVKNGLILLNSTTTSCYFAKVNKGEIIETGVVDKNKIKDLDFHGEIIVLKEEQDVLGLEYNNCRVVTNLSELYSACVINKLNTGDYGDFVPYYLQLSQAERNLK